MNSPAQAESGRARTVVARIALTTGVTLAAVGAAIMVGTPAQAGVSTVTVAAPAGLVAQSATAQCPIGEFLSGAAGGILGGGGDVTLTDVIPNLVTRSVTVWGHTNSAATPAYSVVAQANCLPGPPPANYQLVQASSGLNAAPTKNVVANCPAGTSLMGTGAQLQGAFGQAFYRAVLPNFALDSNTVFADAIAGFGGNWEATAYGICATPPGAAPFRIAQTFVGGPTPANAKSQASGPCGAVGARTTGVGATAAPGAAVSGFVFISRMSTNLAQSEVTVAADEGRNPGANVAWDLAAYNICWTP
jgi:hypothetical protein